MARAFGGSFGIAGVAGTSDPTFDQSIVAPTVAPAADDRRVAPEPRLFAPKPDLRAGRLTVPVIEASAAIGACTTIGVGGATGFGA